MLITHKTLLAVHKLLTRRYSDRQVDRDNCKLTETDRLELKQFQDTLTAYLLHTTPESAQLHKRRKTSNTPYHILQPTAATTAGSPRAKLHTMARTLDTHPKLQPDEQIAEFSLELEALEREDPYSAMLNTPIQTSEHAPKVEDKSKLEDLTTPDWSPADA